MITDESTDKDIEFNYYPLGEGEDEDSTGSTGSNITPSAGGSVVNGGDLRSPNFVKGSSGWQLDSNGNAEFNDGVFRGSLEANTLDIPNATTSDSFHVDATGNMWLGATTFASAPAKISKAGAGTFSSITITGGSIDGTSTINGVTGTDISYVGTSTADAVPTGLAYSTGGITSATDGTQSAYATITWTAISTNTFDHYLVRYKKASLTYYTQIPANTNTITVDGLVPNTSYNFGVASVNKYGTASAFSSNITQTTVATSTAPATVANVSATGGIQYSLITWDSNTETDLASYNIYRSTTANPPGDPAVVDSYSETNASNSTWLYSGSTTKVGQSFTVSSDVILTSAQFYLKKSGSPTGNAVAKLYAHSGTYGTSSKDTGSALATSDNFDVSTLTTSNQLISFTFSGANQYSMTAGYYCITLEYSGGDVSNKVVFNFDSTSPTHSGNFFTTVPQDVNDCCFYVNGGSFSPTLIGNCRTNYFVDGNRTGGTLLYYWVKAVNTSGIVSSSYSTVTSCTPRNVTSDDVVTLAGSKVLIDGTTYLSNWRHSSDVTKIDGGDIYTGSVTTTQLNFTPVQGSNVIASINSSEEGITIDADNLTISAATTFASGYDPTSKTDEVGGTYDSAASGARVRIFPSSSVGIQVIDDASNDVFKAEVGGTNVGDVTIGNYAGGQGVKYDKSAGEFSVKTSNITLGGTNITVSAIGGLQTALNAVSAAGGGTVFLQPGTYTLTADISIPSGVTLQGISRDDVIIDCDTSYKIKIIGSNNYTTGTASVNDGSTSVTGSGTTWTAAMEGRFMYLNGNWYEISTVDDATTITLVSAYQGSNLSGYSYAIATLNLNATVSKLTIYNATGTGMQVQYASEPNIKDLIVYDCGTGLEADYVFAPNIFVSSLENGVNLDMSYCGSIKVDYSVFNASTSGAGVVLSNCVSSTFFDSGVSENTGDGINITSCNDIAFVSVSVSNNGGQGVELVSGNNDIQFVGVTADGNTSDGYKLTATSDRISISTCSIINNGGYGVNIAAATCDNNYIVAPSFYNNTSGNISNSGTDTIIIKPGSSTQTFTSSGTWTKPVGLKFITVKAWGGGGSGGRADSGGYGGGGGGGGGYAEKTIMADDLGTTETVTIGNGGAATASVGNGNVGGNTTFGSLLTAYGGGAGGGVNSSSGAGGGGGGSMQVGTDASGTTAGTGGATPSAAAETDNSTGGGGGGTGGGSNIGGRSYLGGGGGGAGGTSGSGTGGSVIKGGGGGGGCKGSSGTGSDGGTSVEGGAGGRGGSQGAGVAGSQPGGGGGGNYNATGGAGGKGKIIVNEFF
jgi:hypothetical protein